MLKGHMSKSQSQAAVITIFCLAIVLPGLQGCVSPTAYNKVVEEKNICVSENANLKTQIVQRDVALNTLKQERDSAGAAAANLQGQNQQLAKMLAEERRQADEAKAAYGNIVSHLKDSLVANEIDVQLMKSGVTVSLPGEVVFDPGSAQLSAQGTKILTEIAANLKDLPYQTLVAGFTDNSPIGSKLQDRYPTNWELAGARAASVVRLLEAHGVNSERLIALSFGEHRAIADNNSAEGRKQNRRIEIRLRPIEFTN